MPSPPVNHNAQASTCGGAYVGRCQRTVASGRGTVFFGTAMLTARNNNPHPVRRMVAPLGRIYGRIRHSKIPPENFGWSWTSRRNAVVVTGWKVTALNWSLATP